MTSSPNPAILRQDMTPTNPTSVGICVRYATGTFTLAFIEFKKNGDVILSQHYGDYQKLDNGTKFNPHVTITRMGHTIWLITRAIP
jgi:hypothetical protein